MSEEYLSKRETDDIRDELDIESSLYTGSKEDTYGSMERLNKLCSNHSLGFSSIKQMLKIYCKQFIYIYNF